MMQVLVTGGAGYVGSHCLRALCDAGHEAVAFDSLLNGHRAAVDKRAQLVVGDLGDAVLLDRTFGQNRFDAVMHFAALAEVGESVRDPLRYYRNNVVNSIALLEAMRRHDVRRLIFSSSCAVYGVPDTIPITEENPKSPINPYGRTKLAIEWVMEDAATAWGLGGTALRYFNAAGASADGAIGEDHDPESHLIPRVLRVALRQVDRLTIFGDDYPTRDGTCVRDYIHVEDLASIHRLAVERQEAGRFEAYNVGTGVGVSVLQVVEAARKVTGHHIPAEMAARRPGDPPELVAKATAVRSRFDWQPKYTDIVRTIETAWNWHRSHPMGFVDGA
jgi:UDP-glucose 4-epimerase